MDIQDMRKLSDKALAERLKEAEAELRELRFQLSSNQLKNVRQARKARKEVARLKTVIAEKAATTNA